MMKYQKMNVTPSIPLWIFTILSIVAFIFLGGLLKILAIPLFLIGIYVSKKIEVRIFARLYDHKRSDDGKTRINVGCGYWSYENWINMDDKKEYDAKLIDFKKPLPQKDGSVQEARIEMKLEFLDNPKFLLEEVSRVCRNNATITILYSWTNFIEHKNQICPGYMGKVKFSYTLHTRFRN